MRTILSAILVAALALTAAGCGDRGEKGKNKDKDVPKPAKGEPSA
jgi:predicted small lipoprotein YifL